MRAAASRLIVSVEALMDRHPSCVLLLLFLFAWGEGLPLVGFVMPMLCMPLLVHFSLGVGYTWVSLWVVVWVGLVLAYLLAYAIGARYLEALKRRWPLASYPHFLEIGQKFFSRWGGIGVIVSPFFKPLRPTVPLAAGCCGMPPLGFFSAAAMGCGLNALWVIVLGRYGAQACWTAVAVVGRFFGYGA